MSTDSKYYEYNPEKRNIFIEINGSRKNHAGEFIASIFLLFASHASSIIEVFLKKRFGERYITMAQSITLFLVLNFGYAWLDDTFRIRLDGASIFMFIFSSIYLGLSIYHRLEIKKYGTTYDFKRFSLSDGELTPFWSKFITGMTRGLNPSSYQISVFLEPLIPIVVGIIFIVIPFTRPVGILLFLCGIVYGVRNFSKAQKGRNWVLDNIDKKISSEMKYDVFIGRKPKQETKGVYLPIDLPDDENLRKSLYNMVEDSFSGVNDLWENDFLDEKDSGGMGNG